VSEALRQGLLLAGVGLGIVFCVLATIAAVVALMGRLDAEWQRREAAHDAEALEREPTLDTTTVVLIAAAVATVLGGRAHVRRIRKLLPGDSPQSSWSLQGRMVLQGSHAITRKTREAK